MSPIIVLEFEDPQSVCGIWPPPVLFFWPHNGHEFTPGELEQVQRHLKNQKCRQVEESRARALYNLWRPGALEDLMKLYKGKPPRSVVPPCIDQDPDEWNWSGAPLKAVI